MRYIFTPVQDASIYEEYPWKNTGLDEILSIGKDNSGTKSIRSLIQFNISQISQSIVDGIIPDNTNFDLNLFVARSDELKRNQKIEVNFISQSWFDGSGYFFQNTNIPYTASRDPSGGYTENDGVTWRYREDGLPWSVSGSDYISSPSSSFNISLPIEDISIDVTSLIRTWISGTVPDNGFLLKFDDDSEQNNKNIGNIKVFSSNSHTVYLPYLTAKWDNQIYLTGSISSSSPANVFVVPRNLKSKYKLDESVHIDLAVRDRYPVKTFDIIYSAFAGNQRLPQTSYFSIVDQQNNTVIIPFDEYSKINCDGNSSYLTFKTQAMYPGRYYKLMIKVVDSGYEHIFDNGYIFTISST